MQRHIDHVLFHHAKVEGLVIGNVDEHFASEIARVARDVLKAHASRPVLPCMMDNARVIKLPRSRHVKWSQLGRNDKDINSAHLSLYQVCA